MYRPAHHAIKDLVTMDSIDPARIAEAEQYLAMSDEDLLLALARTNTDHAFPEDQIQWARTRLRNLRRNLRSKICTNDPIRKLATDGPANRKVLLVLMIADLVATKGAAVFGAALVREGLATYCKTEWHENGRHAE
jgi:hypothetical protein